MEIKRNIPIVDLPDKNDFHGDILTWWPILPWHSELDEVLNTTKEMQNEGGSDLLASETVFLKGI